MNKVPRLASRSRFGVLISDLGFSREILLFMSSMTMNRTFGLAASVVINPSNKENRMMKRGIMAVYFSVGNQESVLVVERILVA